MEKIYKYRYIGDQDQDFFYVLFYISRNCGKVVDNKQIQEMQSGEMGVC